MPTTSVIIKWAFIILCALLLAGLLFFSHLDTESADREQHTTTGSQLTGTQKQ
ncbi:hypothetical protein [Halodesulfovibrio spirochaetisodalis]|uniref:hypothetical protein n=1 Tax=Halodesulfovibrio spirochaetisodalis TaxID=1560234 RepID=UPI000AFE7D91|nr:hypothetical protein [Halodesulfovibrio spirochaetisodalis]